MSPQKRWTLIAVILGSGIVFLDSTVVNVALPRIGKELHSSFLDPFAGQNFVYYGYLLSLSALLILAGVLNDYYGRRRMFLLGLGGFGASSVLCGIAPSMETLIAFRILQGAAGALLVPGSLAIINATFEGEEQGRAFGLWAGASAGTTLLGPFIGGILVDAVSWRAVFLINVPLVILGLYTTARHVAESRDEEVSSHFDWGGAGVVFLAVGGLSFGAIIGQQNEWGGTLPYVSLGIGAAATVWLPFLMSRSEHPLVPLSMFRSRNFTVTNVSTFLIYGALYVAFAFLVIFLQGTLRYNASAAGLVGIPATLPLAIFSSRFGKLAARYGPRLFMSVGPAIMGVGILLFSRIPPDSTAWILGTGTGERLLPPASTLTDIVPGYVVFGLGLMMLVAPLTTALMNSVPKHNSGVASAVNNAISRVGPQLAGALIFVAIAGSFYAGVRARVPEADTSSAAFRRAVAPLNRPDDSVSQDVRAAALVASTHSLHVAMILSAGLLFAGAGVNAVGIRNPSGPAWMQHPKDAERGVIVRLGPERGSAVSRFRAPKVPPWLTRSRRR